MRRRPSAVKRAGSATQLCYASESLFNHVQLGSSDFIISPKIINHQCNFYQEK
jgi:hypothetical protein